MGLYLKICLYLITLITLTNCEKSKKMNVSEKLKFYKDYKKFENTSFLLLDKKKYNRIEFDNPFYMVDELIEDLNKKENIKETHEIIEMRNFLLNISKFDKINSVDFLKLKFCFISFKCDVLFSEYWYLTPRYLFSDDFIKNYKNNTFFTELKKANKSKDINEHVHLPFFQKITNDDIRKFIKNFYPELYHSNNFSKLDPGFLKTGFLSSLDDEVIIIKIDEMELRKILNSKNNFDDVYICEKELISLRSKYLKKGHLIEDILFEGEETYDD